MAKQETIGPTQSSPTWMGDFGSRDYLLPAGARLDPAQFLTRDAVRVEVTGIEAGGSVSLDVIAISDAIPSGTTLVFDAATDKYATTDADAAAGAVAISVLAIPTALAANDFAHYEPNTDKPVQSGIPIGRSFAEAAANTGFGPAVVGDDEIYLLAFDLDDAGRNPDCELYRPGGAVKEDHLPGWAVDPPWEATLLAALRVKYQFYRSVD